jgi:chaperonin cofactor prefoldin
MTMDTTVAKHAVLDKLQAQISTAEAKLNTLKARAETAKANAEIKAIAELLPKTLVIQRKLHELKEAGVDRWEQAKTNLETQIAEFEKAVKELESKLHSH